jgi:biotin carboxyl carrier protein
MDFPNDPGTPVLAAGDGVVISVKGDWVPVYVSFDPVETPDDEATPQEETPEPTGETDSTELEDQMEEEVKPRRRVLGPYGNFIIIRHDWGWRGQPVYTLYGHLLEIFVQEGDWVQAGDLIAGVGNTGASSGPHLHFEVRLGENEYSHTVNPALWLAPYAGWGTLAGRVTTSRGSLLYNAILTIAPADSSSELDEARILTTYAGSQGRADELWNENFVIPDLPAGNYRLSVQAGGEVIRATVAIRSGVTTFLKIHTSPGHGAVPTPLPTATEAGQ